MEKRSLFRLLTALGVFCLTPAWAIVHAETTSNSGATAITALPYTVSSPGTYYLTQNLSANPAANAAAIYVNVSGVTIDFNGHTITDTGGTSNTAICIYGGDIANVTVRNGAISGFWRGVALMASSFTTTTASYGHLVENVSFIKNTLCACALEGVGNRIYRCRAVLTGGAGGSGYCPCFELDGTGNTIEDCDMSNKIGSNVVVGVVVTTGPDNFLLNNRVTGMDYGLDLQGSASGGFKYSNTLTSGVSAPYSGGTNAGNNN